MALLLEKEEGSLIQERMVWRIGVQVEFQPAPQGMYVQKIGPLGGWYLVGTRTVGTMHACMGHFTL
jgi:hypothetical protein